MVPHNLEEVYVLKVRIKFKKYGALRFIGHLDVMRYFQKAMRRAQIPIAFSGGYSPHMIMSFANPLGIGLSSEGEYFDIELKEPISSEKAVEQLNAVMVEGMEVLSFRQISDEKKMTGMALVAAADYLCTPKKTTLPENVSEKIAAFLAQPEIRIVKPTKRSEREVDIRPLIYTMYVKGDGIFMQVAAGSVENLKPEIVLKAFYDFIGCEYEEIPYQHHRMEIYADLGNENERELISLEDLGTEIIA